jgi:hypothetical protein
MKLRAISDGSAASHVLDEKKLEREIIKLSNDTSTHRSTADKSKSHNLLPPHDFYVAYDAIDRAQGLRMTRACAMHAIQKHNGPTYKLPLSDSLVLR